jgi:hypothetical protein
VVLAPTAAMESRFLAVARAAGKALRAAPARDFASPSHVKTAALAFRTTTQVHQHCIHALALPATAVLPAGYRRLNLAMPGLV